MPEELRQVIESMAWQVSPSGERLEVVLIPSDDRCPTHQRGRMVRQVTQKNAEWYRDFVNSYEASRSTPRNRRKHDTRIKRKNVYDVLTSMLRRGYATSSYGHKLIELAREEKQRWDDLEAQAELDNEDGTRFFLEDSEDAPF